MASMGNSMERARKKRGLSRPKLSALAGVSELCIWKSEHDLSIPNLYSVIALADALNVSIDEYIGRTCNE